MRLLPILFAAALCMPARAADLLPFIRERMTQVLLRQPNYTCMETVERSRQATGDRSRIDDTLRLEVALVDGKEMFAWPGSKQFEDRQLSDLVASGMFGNGNFALYARILFLTNSADFENRGEAELGGRPMARYDFRVQRLVSGHRLRVNDREAVVGFHGSFYADPVTLEVHRIEVVAEDIPAELGVTSAETSVNYARLKIGDEEFLLPVESELMMSYPGMLSRNWIRFSTCRRFAGESTLLFSDPELAEVVAPAKVLEVQIPAGLTLELGMPDLNLMQAAAGDPIRAILRSDLKNRRQLLAPKGSIAQGRIVFLERHTGYFALQIEFQDLNWPGGHARLKLSFDQLAFASRVISKSQPGGELIISRQAGPRLSGILMFWRSEP